MRLTAMFLLLLVAPMVYADTGLDFPGSTAVPDGETVRFKFTNPHTNGLPLYGPNDAGVTYIWRVHPRQQAGYYTAFFWANDDGGEDMCTFLWVGNCEGATAYYGAHPYPPQGSSGTAHEWEIAANQNDFLNGTVNYDRWYTQAFRTWADGNGTYHEYYFDLPYTGSSYRVMWTGPPDYGQTNPPSPALTWGDAPWQPGREVMNGVLRGIQIYSTLLSLSDMQSEVDAPLSTAAGVASIWYLKLNPTPTDIADDSGKGNTPSWVGSRRPTFWESVSAGTPGEVGPLLVKSYDPITGNLGISYTPACESSGHDILFGPLEAVSTYGWSGSVCDIGNTGQYDGFNPGEGSFFYLIVGNAGSTEGPYGTSSQGTPRSSYPGSTCARVQDLSATCL